MNCDQCGKPVIVNVNKHPLCVSCYALLQQTETARVEANNDYLRLLSAQINHELDQMNMAFGIPMNLGRIQIPQRAGQQYNTVHSVRVEGGTVGAINTGEAQSIAVAIGTSEKQGNKDLAAALTEFTNELTKAQIDNSQKCEMGEQLAALSEELTKPTETRRRAVVAPMLDALSKAVVVSTGLVTLWERLHPLLKQAFGLP
jgi:uncharacterized FlaG/YvyC family protein